MSAAVFDEQLPQAMDEDPQSSDDGSDSDDSDFEEVDVGEEDVALITKLEAELEANPNLYDLHLQVTTQRIHSLPRNSSIVGVLQQGAGLADRSNSVMVS